MIDSDVERMFSLIEGKTANYLFFFENAIDPSWIPHLVDRGYFSDPPGTQVVDGQDHAPFWPPLLYLKRVARKNPTAVVDVVQRVPKVDNYRIKLQILDIALELPGPKSAMLKAKVLDIDKHDLKFWSHSYVDLLRYWIDENEVGAALELLEILVQFEPDSRQEEKRDWYRELGVDITPPAEPVSYLRGWEYREMFQKCICPLAAKEPFRTACVLVHTTEKTVRLHVQEEPHEGPYYEDNSEAWCRKLDSRDGHYQESSNTLVEGLAYACGMVFEKEPELTKELDAVLRAPRWKIFRRLRQHLYARNLSVQTMVWIRELIVEEGDYSRWIHGFERQQMIRDACEHFGEELLTIAERTTIFEVILSGPPKERYQERLGDELSDEHFSRYRRHFHEMQLRPFSSVLFGQYLDYYQELLRDGDREVSDENYLLIGDFRGGAVIQQSPIAPEELSELTDTELLDYINQWDEGYRYES